MIGKMISHYRILEKIGGGGVGDVYKAEDTKLRRIVALKFLSNELTRDLQAQQRFVHEAQAASALDHPNIGTIYEINDSDGQFFIAMAYYEGKTLKDKIESDKDHFDINEAINITIQILNGLAKAHAKDIIHRDIKPANILLSADEQVKIIDFGLAKLKGQTQLTKSGSTLGTAAYMSPEQAKSGVVDQRTDIWSVGVILYEMLASHNPFQSEYEQALMYMILNEEPEFITKVRPNVPLHLEKILLKALMKNPEKRYQSVEEMLKEVKQVAEEFRQGQSTTASVFKLGRKQIRIFYRSVAVVFVLVIIGIYIWQIKVIEAKAPSIILLPLKSITDETSQEWFTDSMTDALITDLAKISNLRTISLASAMQYKGTDKTPPQIAAELGVQYLIEGSIQKLGDKVKLSTRLINAPEDEYLWAQEYEQEFSDILALQGELARAIARQIQVELNPQEAKLLTRTRPINPDIHELYLKGMYHINKATPEGISKGLEYLYQAIEKDSTDALAYAGLALGYNLIAHTPSPPPEAMKHAKYFSNKTIKLDSTLAEAHLALAMAKVYGDWDRKTAEQSYKKALKLKPNLSEAHNQYSWLLLLQNKNEEAINELDLAQEYDPLNPAYPAWQSMLYNWLNRPDDAIAVVQKSFELFPDFPLGLMALGTAYAAKDRFEDAINVLEKLGKMSLDFKWCLGLTFARAGQKDKALAVAVELESQPKVWYTWGLAEIYTELGNKDKAFFWLEEAFKQRHPYIQWIKIDPVLKPLRDDPRFIDLAQRLNLKV